MKVLPSCPNGKYVEGMKIQCTKTENRCAHVYFKRCKGWWANTDQAERCPLRREQSAE